MDLSASWTPSFNGNALTPLPRYRGLVDDDEKPALRRDPAWARSVVANQTANTPGAEGPIWESVLALWRLKEVPPDAVEVAEDAIWGEHVSAWLVSHSSLRGAVRYLTVLLASSPRPLRSFRSPTACRRCRFR